MECTEISCAVVTASRIGTQQWFDVEMHPLGPLDLLHDYKTFCPGFVGDRKRGTAVAS